MMKEARKQQAASVLGNDVVEEDEPEVLSMKKGIKTFLKSFVSSKSIEVVTIGEKLFSNGDKYHGQLVDLVMHGYGFYQYVDGAIYEGEMHRGQRHGLGTYQSLNGERYIGEFKHNQRHGRGVKYCLDGQILDGNWQYGVFITEQLV